MSVKHIGLVLDHLNAAPPIKLVALILADHADVEGICWPSYRTLAQRSCQSERTVRRHIKELQDLGIITKLRTGTIVKREGKTHRLSNAYRLNAHVLTRSPSLLKVQKLSTIDLGISDTDDHLKVATRDTSRWSPLTTKPSYNRNSNRNSCGNVDNFSEDPTSLGSVLDDLIKDMT